MDLQYLQELLRYDYEKEWLEFKENWFDPNELGEYISALSNAAAECGQRFAYFIWGITNDDHKIVGTSFNPDRDVKNESLSHFLVRQVFPNINFRFEEMIVEGKRIVILSIPAAQGVPTEFNKERFIRIGSSKELLRKYPQKEAALWIKLQNMEKTIITTESPKQDLKFSKLLVYYMAKGLALKENTFADNLNFYVPNTRKYNLLAFLMADENDITIRVSVFSGKQKTDNLFSIKDFGHQCILYAIDQILNYFDAINIIQADERDRVVERKDVPLFDNKSLREALLNAFIHNDWMQLNAPMISVFSDRIDILSYGGLPYGQTLDGFYEGKSQPRSRELAEIFLQLRISERSGRGVSKIVENYGKKAFEIKEDFIKVSLIFHRINVLSYHVEADQDKKSLGKTQKKGALIMERIVTEMLNNPNIKTEELMAILRLSKTSVQKYIRLLTEQGSIKRVGSTKAGYWQVKE